MKKPQLYILIFILLILPSISLAQEDTWTKKADMPTARTVLYTSVVNGKIYAIGGTMAYGGPGLSAVEEYDPATDTWTKKTDMPTARRMPSTSVVNGKIYAIGGGNDENLSTVEEYNPATDTWTKKADMPTARRSHAASVVNGKIYVIGGYVVQGPARLSTVEEYDPVTDTWTKKTDMLTGRSSSWACTVDGKIYAIGGWDGMTVLSSIEEYDPETDTWKKTDMPSERGFHTASVVNGKIYIIGGNPGSSKVEEYEPTTDTWARKADLPTPRNHLSSSAVNGYIYVIGGDSDLGRAGLSTVEEYDTGMGVRVTKLSPQEGSITGGEPIAIFGKEFPSDAIVTIGGESLTEVNVTNTLITGIIPRGTKDENNVLITAPSLDFTVFAGKFFYNPISDVVVTSITPNRGKQAGGGIGRVTGSGFLPGAMVTIGGRPAEDVDITPMLIIFKIPPGTEGTKDVVVTNPDGQKGMLRGGYTYNPLPVIEKVVPDRGLVTGGTQIIITGNHFMEGAVVTIGVERVQRLDFFSTRELYLRTPPGTLGPKAVRVMNPDGQLAVLEEGFTYESVPAITEGIWTTRSYMPTARHSLHTSVVNGNIYAIGGKGALNFILSDVEKYDPATNIWTRKADMPTPRDSLSTSTVNEKIYAIGGFGGESLLSVEEYNSATDTWTRKADMPTPRWGHAASVVDGKIYVIGGHPDSARVDEYDPATDTWTRIADLPTPRANLSASAVNGYIYAIGGSILSTVEAYDTGVGVRVQNISPQEGLVTGGESIAIFGIGFPSGANVTIGGQPLTAMNVTDTLITGIIPPGTEGEKDILINAPSIGFTVFAGKFIYNPISDVVVTRINPINGKQAGGDMGSITGGGFLPGATVTIGGVEVTDMLVISSTLITFTMPPGTEGGKDVMVTNPGGQEGILRQGYTYNPFPIVEDIEPNEGPRAGGTRITITGIHFMDGVVIIIGGERVQKLDFFSPAELHLRTPPGTVGSKDIRVLNPDGQEVVLKDGFTYNLAPAISSVSPNMGPVEGGTRITIIGTGFLSEVDVLIGSAEAYVVSVAQTKIKAKTPPSTPGIKDLEVINLDGQKVTFENAFTYNPSPQITRIIPDNGRLAGGSKITIRGSGFLPKAKVLIKIGGRTSAMAAIQVMSPNVITAVTPAGEPGPKDVVVRNPDRQEIVLQGGFTYNPMPKITDVLPDHGPTSGGTKIIIRGTGFLQGAKVIVGKSPATAEFGDNSTIEAVTPKNPQGVFDVVVINPDTQEAIKRKGFISVGELAYNYPNPFRVKQGTTFRYVTNEGVELITVKIFNLAGVPIGVVGQSGSNEVRWYDASVHAGLYVYLMEVRLDNGDVKQFRRMLEVYK